MDRTLATALQDVGYSELYEHYISNLGPENPSGERRAISPFPFSNETSPSFFVNVHTGMWTDYHAQNIMGISGGNYVQFVAWMNAQQVGAEWIVDYDAAERNIKFDLGVFAPIEPGMIAHWQTLMRDNECEGHSLWRGRKPWNQSVLRILGIGYDPASRRLAFPVYDNNNNLINAKLYLPGATGSTAKHLWAVPGIGGTYLFPNVARNDTYLILVEGEPDVITLRALGFFACCSTGGGNSPVPPGTWYYGKTVYVWMDNDAVGRQAANTACEAVADRSENTFLVDFVEFDGRPSGADVSDLVRHLLGEGFGIQQIQAEITRYLQDATRIERAEAHYDSPAVDTEFSHVLSAENDGIRMRFPIHVMGKTNSRYHSPHRVRITCPAEGHTYCGRCPMGDRWHGRAEITLDPRSPDTLKYVQTTEEKMQRAIIEAAGIPKQCPDPIVTVTHGVDVEHIVGTSIVMGKDNDLEGSNKVEVMVITNPKQPIKANEDYTVEGFVYPSPNTRAQVVVADVYVMKDNALTNATFTPHERATMDIFVDNTAHPFTMMQRVSTDLENSVTRIIGRQPLHMLYRTVWHSIIEFPFMGDIVNRGWIEAMVVGDTRCGKSVTFKKLSELYNQGLLVDCKMQSPAGIIGAVENSAVTGERFVVAGLWPRQDKRGPVCMDEFQGAKHGETTIMDYMSSMRAEGKVVITKAGKASYWARVRSIWLANPGRGRLIKDIGGCAVEIFNDLVTQPEDIARFDIGMCVSQDEVPTHVINSVTRPTTPIVSEEAHRNLLRWAWSRTIEQIRWEAGAEEEVLNVSNRMILKYDSEVALVEPADQRKRVAKIAVSIAAQCYSTTTGDDLIIRRTHVEAAEMLFYLLYDNRVFAYDRFSQRIKQQRIIYKKDVLVTYLDVLFKQNPLRLATMLLGMTEFNLEILNTIIPMPPLETRTAITKLLEHRAILPLTGARNRGFYRITEGFVSVLRMYIENQEVRSEKED